MAVGLKYGTLEPTGTAPRPAYARTKAIIDRFQERFGTTQCGDITRPWVDDFANPGRVHCCAELVAFVMEQLQEILKEPTERQEWEESWWEDYLTRRDKVT
jgi:hypothetical protein